MAAITSKPAILHPPLVVLLGTPATSFPFLEQHREVAAQAILNVLQKGWSLNNLVITREGRAINRKRLGIV